MSNKHKLKRDRATLDDISNRIITRRASSSDPFLRRYVPLNKQLNDAGCKELSIDDWRKNKPSGQVEVEDVENRIICGDSQSVLMRIPNDSIDCIITSPPYWNVVDYGFEGQLGFCSYENYLIQLLSVWRECERVLRPNGKLCIEAPIMPISKKVIGDQHTRHIKNINNDIESVILTHLNLHRYSLYVWQKQTTEKMFGSYPYPPNIYEQNTIEFINVFVKPGKPRKLSKAVKDNSKLSVDEWMNLTQQVWRLYPADVKRAGHPAPFPESIPNRLIAMYTFATCTGFAGDIVLDPFCGTGATCVAAKNLERRYIGIDMMSDFCISAGVKLADTICTKDVFII